MENKTPILELEIYLIRHAQSNGNAGIKVREVPTIADLADPLLSELGITQAKLLGEYLSDVQFDYVYSSALRRALRTATEVINKQAKRQALRILPLLTENGLGNDYEGASWEELQSINPEAALAPDVDENAPVVCYSDAKDEPSLFERAKNTIDYLRSHHGNGEKICVVSHAAFITYIVFHLMGLDKTPIYDIDFANTGVTKISFYTPGTNKYGDIIFNYINSTAHFPKDMYTQ
ncbi:MAG: histidine phosphatase family protein [Clostridia bacterium]|nr:histidine phosphatase family protein [Clostridia bacterium]